MCIWPCKISYLRQNAWKIVRLTSSFFPRKKIWGKTFLLIVVTGFFYLAFVQAFVQAFVEYTHCDRHRSRRVTLLLRIIGLILPKMILFASAAHVLHYVTAHNGLNNRRQTILQASIAFRGSIWPWRTNDLEITNVQISWLSGPHLLQLIQNGHSSEQNPATSLAPNTLKWCWCNAYGETESTSREWTKWPIITLNHFWKACRKLRSM